MGERLEGFLDRAHEDALIAAVAQEVAQIVPCCSIGLDDKDSLLAHRPLSLRAKRTGSARNAQVACQMGEEVGPVYQLVYICAGTFTGI